VALSDLKPKLQQEYVGAFLASLMEMHQEEGHPTLIVVDEMQRFGAQGSNSSSHDALWDVATRGGKRGFCLIGVTPRLSDLSKSVAGGLQNKFIFRTTLDNDIERSGRALGFRTRAERDELTRLEDGECFAYGPAIGATSTVQRVRGVSETRTTHVDVNRNIRPAPPPSPAALKGLVAELRDAAQQAADVREEAADVEQLRGRVKELERQLAARPEGRAINAEALDVARLAGATAERHRQERVLRVVCTLANATAAQLRECGTLVLESAAGLEGMVEELACGWTGVKAQPDSPDSASRATITSSTSIESAGPAEGAEIRQADKVPDDAGELVAGEQRILNAAAELAAIGVSPASRAQVGLMAGYDLAGGKPHRYAANLVSRRLLVIPDADLLQLTAVGAERAAPVTQPLTLQEVQRRVLGRLNDGERRILEYVIAIYPSSISLADLGTSVGYNLLAGGKPLGYVRRLVSLGFAVAPKSRTLRASDLLFPKVLR
jgi:hypothetical protein